MNEERATGMKIGINRITSDAPHTSLHIYTHLRLVSEDREDMGTVPISR